MTDKISALDSVKLQKGYEKVRSDNPMFTLYDKYDIYVWRYKCSTCPNAGYIYGEEAYELRSARPLSKYRKKCKACRSEYVELYYKVGDRKAVHLNNIRRRETSVSSDFLQHE